MGEIIETPFGTFDINNPVTPIKDFKSGHRYGYDSLGNPYPQPDHNTVTLFEERMAEFFGAPYAVAVDSCTHGLELCLRFTNALYMHSPKQTYLSIPMLANKLKLYLNWTDNKWDNFYQITPDIVDAAVFWHKGGYWADKFMCISFQYQKHLSLGRGGMILCPDEESAKQLKKMSYDGRLPGIPWREQNIDTMGYHYYCTPETAQLGLDKLDKAIATEPRKWGWQDYPILTEMDVFKQSK